MNDFSQSVAIELDNLLDTAGLRVAPVKPHKYYREHRYGLDNDWIRLLAVLLPFAAMLLATSTSDIDGRSISTIGGIVLVAFLVSKLTYFATAKTATYLLYFFLFLVFIPGQLTTFSIMQACVFGLVFGEWVFGGRGYSFIHPVLCALVYLFLDNSTAGTASNLHIDSNLIVFAAIAVSTALLLWFQCLDWRILVSLAFSVIVLSLVFQIDSLTVLPSPAVLLLIVLVLCDPASTPTNQLGRLLYGVLLGSMLLVFDNHLASLRGAVFAGFFATLCAPLIDWLIINLEKRETRGVTP